MGIDGESLLARLLQRRRHIRILHEPVLHAHVEHVMAQRLDRDAIVGGDMRLLRRGDGQHHNMFVQDFVMAEIVRERRWCSDRLRGHEDRGARHAQGPRLGHHGDELFKWDGARSQPLCDQPPSRLPRCHQREEQYRNSQRDPAALHHLQRVGAEEGDVDQQERRHHGEYQRRRPVPHLGHHHIQEQHGDDHRQRYSNAIRGRDSARRPKPEHDHHRGNHQRPIHLRHIDLTDLAGRGVLHVETRSQAELDRLSRNRERAGNERLRGDDGCGCGNPDQRQ